VSRPRLLFVVESPFSERDRSRFGVQALSDTVDVLILDLCRVVKPHLTTPGDRAGSVDVFTAKSIEHALSILRTSRPRYALLNLGIHDAREAIIDAARDIGSTVVEFQLGAIPEDDLLARPWITRLRHSSRMQPNWRAIMKHFAVAFVRRFRKIMDYPSPPDAFVYAGLAALHHVDSRTQTRIAAHSFDCEIFRNLQPEPGNPTGLAVYIDQEIGYHPDLDHDRLRSPVEPVRFHSELREFFSRFTALTGIDIGVAVHPRADRNLVRERLGSEVIILDDTARSIRDSKVVLAHASTAISFAVLWGKPSIHLTSRRLRRGWYGPLVERFAHATGSPLIRLDDPDDNAIMEAIRQPIDSDAYDRYRRRYLTTNAELRPLWPTILSALEELPRIVP